MGRKSVRKRRPTQADVARLAGVSQATVSYVLNEKTAIAVPAETRQRIQQAVEALGYVPHGPARSLRTRRTMTIASAIPDIANPFYPAFERGIQDVAEKHGYDLMMYNTDGVAEKERKFLRTVRQGRADAVIVVPFHLTAEDFLPLLEINVSVVILGPMETEVGGFPLDCLYPDNIAAARAAVSYLVGRGHSRIAMIAGQEDTPAYRNRLLGYQQALAQHQIPLDPVLVRSGSFKEEGGYRAMRDLLGVAPRPSAVFACNDLMAMGALAAIREVGLRIPGDIAVVGFDNIPAAKLVNPPLTTIAQFEQRLGERAAEMLFERLSGTAPQTGRCEAMPFSLVVRESA